MLKLGLRLRVFLFFAALALGSAAVVLGAVWLGHARSAGSGVLNGFVLTGLVAVFGTTALVTAIWLMFDENVARPIEALSTAMRARVHANAPVRITPDLARYLGDLAPAVGAVSQALESAKQDQQARLAQETAALRDERARLAEILSELPTASILTDPLGRIIMYDRQAAHLMAPHGTARLGAPLSDYFGDTADAMRARVLASGTPAPCLLPGDLQGRMAPLSDGSVLLTLPEVALPEQTPAARPLVWDFDLARQIPAQSLADTPLDRLAYVVFDTETTGLLPHRDEIVQIGALRLVSLRPQPGEAVDVLVNPGRPIPAAATAVHRITDGMVRNAPGIDEAAAQLHALCKDAVIVAHNAPFDMAFLHRAAQRSGLEWSHPVIDTVLVSAVVYGTTETHTLDALCQRLAITIPDHLRHSAMGDAQATAEAYCRMVPMLAARGITTLADLLEHTRQHGRLLKDMND